MFERKHCKKLSKYIQRNELSKFRSYIKRYSLDVVDLLDEQGNSLLHLSCKFGSEVILRYLLKNEADVLLKNKLGDLPIHVACQYAQQGHKYAETDLVLPLVRKNPSCLTVKNDAGVTARQLLQDFKDRMKLRCRQRHHHPEVLDCVVDCRQSMPDEMSYSNSHSESFEEKLAREMEDEYSAQWGMYEEDFGSYEQEYETWNAWADRMAKEHAARCHAASDAKHHTSRHKNTGRSSTSGVSDIPKISPRKRKLFEEKMKASQEEHRRYMEQSRREKIGLHKLQYERDCIALYKPTSCSVIGFDEVPWPHSPGTESPLREVVTEFLFGDLQPGCDTYQSYLRLQRIRWHPDRFVHRCGERLKDFDRDRILDKVKAISQILNNLHETLSVGH